VKPTGAPGDKDPDAAVIVLCGDVFKRGGRSSGFWISTPS
jgi:hypothetical protein